MLTVRLHGHLERKYGSEFKFNASTPQEAIAALRANFDDFTEEFIKDERAYCIVVDFEPTNLMQCYQPISSNSVIDIIPAISGAGNALAAIGMVIVGVLLIMYAPILIAYALPGSAVGAGGVLAGTFATISSAVTAIGWGLALAGVASLLAAPKTEIGGGTATSFNRTDNIVGQGYPVPIGYGRLLVGSMVLSATYTSSYLMISNAWSYDYINTSTNISTPRDYHMNVGGLNLLPTPEELANLEEDAFVDTTYDGGYSTEQLFHINDYVTRQLGANYSYVNDTIERPVEDSNGNATTIRTVVPKVLVPQYYGTTDIDWGSVDFRYT